jgi:hypothetical protein
MGLLADLNVPISLANSSSSALQDDTEIDFGAGSLFGESELIPTTTSTAAAAEGGTALATPAAGAATSAGSSTPISGTTLLMLAAVGIVALYFTHKEKGN